MAQRPDLDTIGSLLSDVQEQYLYVKSLGSQPDPLDVELLEATVQFMATNISVYRKSLEVVEEIEEEVTYSGEVVEEEQVEEEEVPEEEVEEEVPEEVEEEEEIEEEVTYSDEVVDEEVLSRRSPAEDLFDAAEVHQPSPSESPSRPMSINEIMANQMQMRSAATPLAGQGTTSNRNEQARVTDLKSAVSLNDKLLFIKDLFNGYSLAYSEAIELLNRYDSLEEADEFLKSNYAVKNQWASRQETVDKLYAILKRRYS